jgi:hypothetical protein
VRGTAWTALNQLHQTLASSRHRVLVCPRTEMNSHIITIVLARRSTLSQELLNSLAALSKVLACSPPSFQGLWIRKFGSHTPNESPIVWIYVAINGPLVTASEWPVAPLENAKTPQKLMWRAPLPIHQFAKPITPCFQGKEQLHGLSSFVLPAT